MKIQIKDIELVFSENQQQFLDKIKMTIQNNYELILSCLGENKTIDISKDESNFNDTFYYIVKEVFNNDNNKQAFSDKDFLSALHVEALIRRKKFFNTTIVEQNPNMSDELLSSLIAYKYFESNGTFDDFVEYLKDRNNEEKIFQWLQDVSRWDTYNYLLNITSNFLKTDDNEFFKQMNYITSIWFGRVIDNIQYKDDSNKEYQKISEKEFDTLFYEFLNYINAPVEWIKIYNELKVKGLIIIEKEKEYDNSMCFLDNDGIFKILIGNGDNLRGFCNFVHEFIHYVSRQKGLSIEKMAVSEFPSIFFEKISAEFLEEKGYSNQIVNQIINDRESNNYSLITSMQPLFSDLIRYINYGEINKSDKMSFYKNLIESINRTRKKLLKIITDAGEQVEDLSAFEEIKVDIEKDVDDECDLMIDSFIKEGLLVINGYQYLLDSYLVEQVLNRRNNDNTIIEKMINVTDNLGTTSVKDILTLFGIENALQEGAAKKLIKK
ncbi:MAG: hypothetical protein IKR74_00375 [Bacilli bacterium]|nr:hypothetical protein [Bacilli bacterium]